MCTYSTLHTQSSNVTFLHGYGYSIEGYMDNLIKTPWNAFNNAMLLAMSLTGRLAFLVCASWDVPPPPFLCAATLGGPWPPHSWGFLDHTRRITVGRTPLDEWSARRRPLPDNTQHSQQTDIHVPGGIRTHNLSRRAVVNLRLRPHGHLDRQTATHTEWNIPVSHRHSKFWWWLARSCPKRVEKLK